MVENQTFVLCRGILLERGQELVEQLSQTACLRPCDKKQTQKQKKGGLQKRKEPRTRLKIYIVEKEIKQ